MKQNIIIPGYTVQITDTDKANRRLLFIRNTDGSIRWIWPEASSKPHFLKFYNVGSRKSRIISLAFRTIFRFRLQRLAFKSLPVLMLESEEGKQALKLDHDNWALFTGTVGPNNKSLLYVETEGKGRFMKIAATAPARSIIANEFETLKWLGSQTVSTFRFPEAVSFNGDALVLEDISGESARGSVLSERHVAALGELTSISRTREKLHGTSVWRQAMQTLQQVEDANDPRIPKGLLRKLNSLAASMPDKPVLLSFSHGDFTSWNMYAGRDGLSVYDWELARKDMPIGFDAFHFLMQQGVLIDRKPWVEIRADIQRSISAEAWQSWTQDSDADILDYLKLYLIINTSNYLRVYNEQPEWHEQVAWLLQTWGMAVSDMLSDAIPHRKLVIGDVFDFLNTREYAALKFPDALPSELSEYSDIDLCLPGKDARALELHLMKHPLTSAVRLNRKSFMDSVHIFLKDGGIITLDLIWKLKRKNLVMMDADRMIREARLNAYGVKQPGDVQLARFIGLFYGLNHSPVPEKYQALMESLYESDEFVDRLLTGIIVTREDRAELVSHLRTLEANRGFSRIRNLWDYLFDTLKEQFSGRGMIITFSGVDGAGKSTMIQLVKTELEKKLRRKVVVLRHRPSLLPILSAWVKGREQAEKAASGQLPHSGGNRSLVSSLIRFTYYYLDYLVGQFYVHLRYVMSSHIVLYDRYYFDFINDSRRSNIRLSRKLTRAGYALLKEPHLNFFLYADPEIILARKKEIDAPTIAQLTRDYKNLFQDLGNSRKSTYHTIENVEMSRTLEVIMSHFNAKLALS